MANRFITRIEMTSETYDKLRNACERLSETKVATLSRLLDWFHSQPATVQSAVLGRYPPEIEAEVAQILLTQGT